MIAELFADPKSWLAIAGLSLFVILTLFRSLSEKFISTLPVTPHAAHWIVIIFMVLTAGVGALGIVLAFLSASSGTESNPGRFEQPDFQTYERQYDAWLSRVDECTAEGLRDVQVVRPFSVRGIVSCPSGGCQGENCNKNSTYARYEAPGAYHLDEYTIEDITTQHGTVGNLEVQHDDDGNIVAVQVLLACDPPDTAGSSSGGLSQATITGVERLRSHRPAWETIRLRCKDTIPGPPRSPVFGISRVYRSTSSNPN